MLSRGDFLKQMSTNNPNEQRFNLEPNYDKSKHNGKYKTISGRKFDTYGKRDTYELIRQGGDILNQDGINAGARTEEYYNTHFKEKYSMGRLNTHCMNFKGYEPRSELPGKSIYARDKNLHTEVYDMDKVNRGKDMTIVNSGHKGSVSMKKQSKRDTTAMYAGSVGEAYANIKRENEKADYIKKLLM